MAQTSADYIHTQVTQLYHRMEAHSAGRLSANQIITAIFVQHAEMESLLGFKGSENYSNLTCQAIPSKSQMDEVNSLLLDLRMWSHGRLSTPKAIDSIGSAARLLAERNK